MTVHSDALNPDGTHGSFLGVAGSWLWNPVSTYQSSQVDDASTVDGLQLAGSDHDL